MSSFDSLEKVLIPNILSIAIDIAILCYRCSIYMLAANMNLHVQK